MSNRIIPDSECKQGKCAATTTGCIGKCAVDYQANTVCIPEHYGVMPEDALRTKFEEMLNKYGWSSRRVMACEAATPERIGVYYEIRAIAMWQFINEMLSASQPKKASTK